MQAMTRWRPIVAGITLNLSFGSLYAWSVFVLPQAWPGSLSNTRVQCTRSSVTLNQSDTSEVSIELLDSAPGGRYKSWHSSVDLGITNVIGMFVRALLRVSHAGGQDES
jgi:hypothetical protein